MGIGEILTGILGVFTGIGTVFTGIGTVFTGIVVIMTGLQGEGGEKYIYESFSLLPSPQLTIYQQITVKEEYSYPILASSFWLRLRQEADLHGLSP